MNQMNEVTLDLGLSNDDENQVIDLSNSSEEKEITLADLKTANKPKKTRGRKPTLTGPKKAVTAQISAEVYDLTLADFKNPTEMVRAVFDFYVKHKDSVQ